MLVAFNISYRSADGGNSSVLTRTPILWEVSDFSEFKKHVRESIFQILEWSHENWVPRSMTTLSLYIREDDISNPDEYWEWSFEVKCENIRGYDEYKDMDRDEFEVAVKSLKRKEKLEELLDEGI
jgi:hypothetical protein